VVVTGAAGAGKSTVGAAVAARLGCPFLDADDVHPEANVAKMASGTPLAETDRCGWLAVLAAWIDQREQVGQPAVLACSALRRSHRDRLRRGNVSVLFVHLAVDEATLRERMERRRDHFMPPSLLGNQLAILEPLDPDEPGFAVEAGAAPEQVADAILRGLRVMQDRRA
jgi:gluconokinase